MTIQPDNQHWHVAGDGAIGLSLGHLLQRGGARVALLVRRSQEARSLHYRDVDGPWLEWDCPRTDRPRGESIERLVVATKAYSVGEVMGRWSGSLAPGARVFLFNNGIHELPVPSTPPDVRRLIVVNSGFAAYLEAPGRVVQSARAPIWIGDGTATSVPGCPRAREDIAFLDACGCHARWTPDIESLRWLKVAVNAVINPLTVMHECRNGALVRKPGVPALVRELCAESGSVLQAMGIPYDGERIHQEVLAVIEATAANRSSMLQDHARGDGRNELEHINGALVRRGSDLGIGMAAHRSVLERASRMFAGRPGVQPASARSTSSSISTTGPSAGSMS